MSVVAACLFQEIAAFAQPSVVGVYLLPAGERASLVVELDAGGHRARAVQTGEADSFVVDIEPVSGTVAQQLLQAPASAPLVREVRVQPVRTEAQSSGVRVAVKLRDAAVASIRNADRRVYIDIAPRPAPAPVFPPPAAPAPVLPRAEPQAPAKQPESDETLIARARELALVPDVKGLMELRAKVATRKEKGSPDPILTKIDEYVMEAQTRQLAKDSELFQDVRRAADYRATLRDAASVLDRLAGWLRSQPSESDGLSTLQEDSGLLSDRIQAAAVPPNLMAAHSSVVTAVEAMTAALSRMRPEDPAAIREALALVERARAAVDAALNASPASARR